ncbi:MAG: hypothetical protein V1866_07395 [archaeon]
MIGPIKAKCKKCGKDVKSDEFVLDPVYKMMVCRDCVKERRMNELAASNRAKQETKKVEMEAQQKRERPAGWDPSEAEIERSYAAKQSQRSKIERIDSETIKYTCPKCKYEFVINIAKKASRCPYCGTPIQGV